MTGIQRLESAPIVISPRRKPSNAVYSNSYTGDCDMYNNNTTRITSIYHYSSSQQNNAHMYSNSLSNLIGNAALDNHNPHNPSHIYDNINTDKTTPVEKIEQRKRAVFIRADSESKAYDMGKTSMSHPDPGHPVNGFVRQNSTGYRRNLGFTDSSITHSADSTFDSGTCSDYNSNGNYYNEDYEHITGRSDVNGYISGITTINDAWEQSNKQHTTNTSIRTNYSSCYHNSSNRTKTANGTIGRQASKTGGGLIERRPVLGTGALTSPSRLRPSSAGVVLRPKNVNCNGVASPARARPTSACEPIGRQGLDGILLRNKGHHDTSSADVAPGRPRPTSVCEQSSPHRTTQGVVLRRRETSADRVYRRPREYDASDRSSSRSRPRPMSTCDERLSSSSPTRSLPPSPRDKHGEASPVRPRPGSAERGTPPLGGGRSKESPVRDLIRRISLHVKRRKSRSGEKERPHSFVNSQEWTISRSVQDLKLGILGSVHSGKSALVHRYLTGSYMQEESPEGGRFKKEVVLDGQSYLLLIRDEGGAPEMQFTHWVDAIIFVFSLENEPSFSAIYNYFTKMAQYRKTTEVPLILVGTQDSISESNPRVIDDSRARKLASDLKHCSYYETCATYGLNVERVFQDACQKILQMKLSSGGGSRPNTPNHGAQTGGSQAPRGYYTQGPSIANKPYDSHSSSTADSQQGHSPPTRDTLRDKEKNQHKRHNNLRSSIPDHTQTHDPSHVQGIGTLTRHGGHGMHHSGAHQAVPVSIPVPPELPTAPPPPLSAGHPPGMSAGHTANLMLHQIPPPSSNNTGQQGIIGLPATEISAMQAAQRYQDNDEMTTPVSTPMLSRKYNKKGAVTKSNSFSGAQALHRSISSATPIHNQNHNDFPTPQSTPVLARKFKSKSAGSDLHHHAARDIHKFHRETSVHSSSGDSLSQSNQALHNPLTPILKHIPRVRHSISNDKSTTDPTTGGTAAGGRDLPTPTGTPTQSRKNRRRSNLFTQKNKDEGKSKNGEVGSGRAIPVKQGHLRKWGTKPLNKEWKRKYVTLTDNGKLTYHQSLNDYMDDVQGKEINLVCTTVKIPGMKPRGSRGSNPVNGDATPGIDGVTQRLALTNCDESVVIPNASLTAGNGFVLNGIEYPPPPLPPHHPVIGSSNPTPIPTNHAPVPPNPAPLPHTGPGGSPGNKESHTPNVKKRHRRAKSGHNRKADPNDGDDSDGYEFVIVSIENKSWQFAAPSSEERDDWVTAIEQQILSSLQSNISSKSKANVSKLADKSASQVIRVVEGNYYCVDCDAPNPDWASLNLGVLMCIECSGSHRNLGTHISRVKSLELDDWPVEQIPVMVSIGNTLANTVWEANLHGRTKPTPASPREEKEQWIKDKYVDKLFIAQLPYVDVLISEQLIDAVARQNILNAIIVLGYASTIEVNTPYCPKDTRTALHIAAALANPALLQLLIWYGADVSLIDHEGRNALWYARYSRSPESIDILCAAGCVDNTTKTPARPNLLTTLPTS